MTLAPEVGQQSGGRRKSLEGRFWVPAHLLPEFFPLQGRWCDIPFNLCPLFFTWPGLTLCVCLTKRPLVSPEGREGAVGLPCLCVEAGLIGRVTPGTCTVLPAQGRLPGWRGVFQVCTSVFYLSLSVTMSVCGPVCLGVHVFG